MVSPKQMYNKRLHHHTISHIWTLGLISESCNAPACGFLSWSPELQLWHEVNTKQCLLFNMTGQANSPVQGLQYVLLRTLNFALV